MTLSYFIALFMTMTTLHLLYENRERYSHPSFLWVRLIGSSAVIAAATYGLGLEIASFWGISLAASITIGAALAIASFVVACYSCREERHPCQRRG